MKKIKENPLIYLLIKMWHYAKGKRKRVVLYVLLSTTAMLIQSLEPLLIGNFLNAIQTDGISKDNLPYLLFLLLSLPLMDFIFWLFHGPSRVLELRNAFFVRANYKNFLLKGTMALPIEWQTNHHSGDTIDKIEKGTQALHTFSCRTFDIINTCIILLTSFGTMFYFDATAASVALFITIITFYILTNFDKYLVPKYRLVSSMENKTSAKIFDALSNITTVIVLRIESLILKSINKFIQKPFKVYDETNSTGELKWFAASMGGRITVFAAVGIYIFLHFDDSALLVGTLYILYGYANRIQATFFKFASLYNDIVRYRTAVSNTEELSDDFIKEDENEIKKIKPNWSVIEINNLSFSYHTEDNADLHLDDVSLTIKNGERIAFIGESGGGKSTLLKVIRDLYHPKSLHLSVDNMYSKKGFKSFSDSISLIPQDPEIFSTTIKENITLGVEYTDEYISKYTDIACFSDVIKRLPNGLDSSIVEKGVNLSGGERQRLALSRGLLASEDKDIILFDEPTSSVDFQNELKIYQNIFNVFPNKTLISSIHRLHLLSLFDSIYFLKDGKIIAKGTFEELKQNSPEFKELWERYINTRDGLN
ncbi:MAG: ABC transporter ATP-binding protein [Patescibacteria group bacterium]